MEHINIDWFNSVERENLTGALFNMRCDKHVNTRESPKRGKNGRERNRQIIRG